MTASNLCSDGYLLIECENTAASPVNLKTRDESGCNEKGYFDFVVE